MMAEVDIDHNGKLDILEFIVFMSKVLNVHFDNMEELKIAFKVFDANGDGKISRDELRHTFRNICGEQLEDDDIDKIISVYDDSKTGFLSYNEFVRMFSQYLLL